MCEQGLSLQCGIREILNGFSHMTHQIEAWNFLYKKKKLFGNVSVPVGGFKTAKNMWKIADVDISAIFRPLRGIKTLQKHFYLVEEVLSFNLVGHL